MVTSGKQLLVLDINGLLLDTYFEGEARPDRPHDAKVNRFYVYKRAFCEEFIQFSLQNFIVGVWSSAREHNVLSLVDFMFKEAKENLAFIWHLQHCTDTGFRHPDNKYKPVFLKELSKLWRKFEAGLPWTKGDYGPSNTLLIDDSPYKAIGNPQHTAIFPKTYKASDPDDNFLAGELLPYLNGLRKARDVQKYIERNPFGEGSINPSDPQWSQILMSDLFKNEEELVVPAHVMAIGAPIRADHMLSNQRMRPNDLLPANGGAVPQLVGAESHFGGAGQGHFGDAGQQDRPRMGRHYDNADRFPQLSGDYRGGTHDSQRDTRAYDEGPSWPSRHTSDSIRVQSSSRKFKMLPRRSSGYGDRSTERDRPYNDSHERHDKRTSVRDHGNNYGNNYENHHGNYHGNHHGNHHGRLSFRSSDWSEEPEDSGRGEPEDIHRRFSRDQEGSPQGEGTRKRRGESTRDPRAVPMYEQPVTRKRERSPDREPDEPEGRFSRHDSRWESNQFKSKHREDVEYRRHRSADSGRHSQQSYDMGQNRSRRKTGKER